MWINKITFIEVVVSSIAIGSVIGYALGKAI